VQASKADLIHSVRFASAPTSKPDTKLTAGPAAEIIIPGPLRSFLRMAAVSQTAPPDEVLPLLAEMVNVRGYARGTPTEYLVLVRRYLQQATELAGLAAPEGVIRVSKCDQAKPLLDILGYRLRNGCEPNASVQVADSDRAFLTIDSGFPLAELEEALGNGKPFVLPFSSSRVPALFAPQDWSRIANNAQGSDLLESILLHPDLARLYGAVSRMDSETRLALYQSPGLSKLLHFSDVLDFYGGHLSIRNGRVEVPGGPAAEAAWKDLVGASPSAPSEFVLRLLARDAGWMAAYFDALATTGQEQQSYFTQAVRLKRFYDALRGPDPLPGATRGVFRPDPGLVLLAVRLQLEPNGQPHLPGDMEVWKSVFEHNVDSRRTRRWGARARQWREADQVVEGLIALSREPINEDSLQTYLTLSDIDRSRAPGERLNPQTARSLAEKFSRFADQYPIFVEFSGLNNASITSFLRVAESLDHIPSPSIRANAIGIFQANIGLWQILARQGEIAPGDWNDSWQRIIGPFEQISTSVQLFDAGRASLRELWRTATGKSDLIQDEVVALLAGPAQETREGREVRAELAARMHSVLNAQRLVSLDTLLTLGEGLTEMSKGKATGDSLFPLAAELRDFEMPRPIFSSTEKFEFQYERSDIRHTTLQTRTNLTTIIKSGTATELAVARGRLAPFLRDTLVGLNYAYYEPPGAQMLLNNTIFVRSHDYTERLKMEGTQPWRTSLLINLGVTAGGGTHLAGSLADLPYILAEVEQDFIVPSHVQSLIWQDLVPSLLTSAVVPRWWRVSQNELHAVALYQQLGETLLSEAGQNEELHHQVMSILSDHLSPRRLEQVEKAIASSDSGQILNTVMPSETFLLSAEFCRRFPERVGQSGKAGKELESLIRLNPEEASWGRLSQDFGVSHPALGHTYARELMNQRFFPTFRDYSSRLLGESWESNNLYWARLADEQGYQPVMLNRLAPQLTLRMVEKLSATTLEDWPALSRALRETGEEFRTGKAVSVPKETDADSHSLRNQ
jgi:hypothetical protein